MDEGVLAALRLTVALRDYLAGEVAEDYADGYITRRDALKRLALLGLSLGGASALLAACRDEDDAEDTATTSTTSVASEARAATSEEIRLEGPDGELIAAFAEPASGEAKGAVLVVHENGGLTDYFRSFVGELASDGYVTLCVDLASRAGGTAKLPSNSEVQAALASAPVEALVADLRAGIDELQRRAPDAKVGVVGFCFGGAMTWNLLDAGESRLAAAVPFYGPAPSDPDFSGTKAAVLGIYAELDGRVNASRDAATQALQRAGLVHEIRTFAGVDHAFFNPTGRRYDEAAATEARAAMLAWFDRHL